MEKTNNIFRRMSDVTEEIGTIPKNLVVGFGRNQYKAVAEKDILSAVKKAERKYGIYSFPVGRKILNAENITDSEGRITRNVRIEATYRFVNMDDPNDYVDVVGYGDGVDSLDKAPGKALTYADKYCLMKAYKIETGDELDAEASDDIEAHNIMRIKQRVETLVTGKLANGMDIKDIYTALNLTEKNFNLLMGMFDKLYGFENALKRL